MNQKIKMIAICKIVRDDHILSPTCTKKMVATNIQRFAAITRLRINLGLRIQSHFVSASCLCTDLVEAVDVIELFEKFFFIAAPYEPQSLRLE